MTRERTGPLHGIRVLEIANIGPLQHQPGFWIGQELAVTGT